MRHLCAVAALALCVVSPPVNASIVPSLIGNPVAVTGSFDDTYNVTLSQDKQIDGSVQPVFSTSHDFGNAKLIGGSGSLASNQTYTLKQKQTVYAQATIPNNMAGTDDRRASDVGAVATPSKLGTVSGLFDNTQNGELEKYSTDSAKNTTPLSNINSSVVPSTSRVAVPEPASLALLGAGFGGQTMLRRRGGRQQAAGLTSESGFCRQPQRPAASSCHAWQL